MTETKLVTFKVDGAYRPISLEFGPEDRTAQYRAHVRKYTVTSGLGTVFHGDWTTEKQARRFASTCGDTPLRRTTVEEVAPYWYAPAFGEVGPV